MGRKKIKPPSVTNGFASHIEFLDSIDVKRKLKDTLEKGGSFSSLPTTESLSQEQILAATQKADHDVRNDMLLNRLSPELEKNEDQKRTLKKRLMIYIMIILTIQVLFFMGIIGVFVCALCFKNDMFNEISIEMMKHMMDFLKYYISATLAEFIAMLFFIVKFVFDKSIVSLIKDLFQNNK